MKFNSLIVAHGIFSRKFSFAHSNLIYNSKNSVGKTTLLRLLLFSLGYPIPSPRKMSFESYEFLVDIETDSKKKLLLFRNNDFLTIESDKTHVEEFFVPADLSKILTIVFEVTNPLVIDNLLGSFYIDQEKGWTLLNRGKVIGKIPFNIERLVLGLSNRSVNDLEVEINSVSEEIEKYRIISSTANYKKKMLKNFGDISPELSPNYEYKELVNLKLEKLGLVNEKKRIEGVIRQNNTFKKYVESMNLFVLSMTGESVPVNSKTIIGFNENFQYLKYKNISFSNQILEIEMRINEIRKKNNENQKLFEVKTSSDLFDEAISSIDLNPETILGHLERLNSKKAVLSEKITTEVKKNNQVVANLHKIIIKYAGELGVEPSYVPANQDYIFTSDLKSLSGAILHKIVFAFKLAYITSIREATGCVVPIIIDSPRSREITQEESEKMMRIIVRDFSAHQLIVASIYEYAINFDNLIEVSFPLLGF